MAAWSELSEHVKLAIEGGATMIQIRDKDILSTDSDAGLKDEYNEALEIKRICHEHKVPLIINDNVQFAIDIDADGVHLGQDDMNPAEARKLLGTDKIIGVTAKTVEQAKGQKLMERTIWEAEPCLALPQSSMQSL